MEIICYIYLTIMAAIEAREQVDAYFGIPVSPDSVTQNYVEVEQTVSDGDTTYFLRYFPEMENVLGVPDTIFLEIPDLRSPQDTLN